MEINYQIIYSDRKTITITVERDCSIIVHAPDGTDPEKVNAVVDSKRLWLYDKLKHPQKYSTNDSRKEFVSGETIPYLGRNYRLEIEKGGDEGIRFVGKFVVTGASAERSAKLFRDWYVQRAKEIIEPRVRRHSRNLGVTYNKVMVSDLKYRWGSCTPNNNLNFNWRLIKCPMFVIDYVIVHELAHFLEQNHTPHFWNIVRAQVQEFSKAKLWLKEHGEILEYHF